jgi:chromosome condensin MukBEF ATPase and DNA-binding subunit MukB
MMMDGEKMADLEREIGGLQARMETVEHELQAIRSDVREIRDTVVRAKGGWMALLLMFSAAAALGAWMMQVLNILSGVRP